VAALVLCGVRQTAQELPDFSGSWVLESTAPGVDVAQTLFVRQLVTRTNVWGEPIAPFFSHITVTRALATGSETETYHIGVEGGTVSGIVAGGTEPALRTHRRVVLEGQKLILESGSDRGGSGWTDRREVWSLESDARLHLEITTRTSQDAARTILLEYRRQ
jgi:hypothetical protein